MLILVYVSHYRGKKRQWHVPRYLDELVGLFNFLTQLAGDGKCLNPFRILLCSGSVFEFVNSGITVTPQGHHLRGCEIGL